MMGIKSSQFAKSDRNSSFYARQHGRRYKVPVAVERLVLIGGVAPSSSSMPYLEGHQHPKKQLVGVHQGSRGLTNTIP